MAGGELDLEALAARPARRAPRRRTGGRGSWRCPGVGPYAAAHIMMTMGRNSPADPRQLDAPDVRAARGGTKPVSDATIRRRFRRYGDHAGLAFWLFVTRDWVD